MLPGQPLQGDLTSQPQPPHQQPAAAASSLLAPSGPSPPPTVLRTSTTSPTGSSCTGQAGSEYGLGSGGGGAGSSGGARSAGGGATPATAVDTASLSMRLRPSSSNLPAAGSFRRVSVDVKVGIPGVAPDAVTPPPPAPALTPSGSDGGGGAVTSSSLIAQSLLDVEASTLARQLGVGNDDSDSSEATGRDDNNADTHSDGLSGDGGTRGRRGCGGCGATAYNAPDIDGSRDGRPLRQGGQLYGGDVPPPPLRGPFLATAPASPPKRAGTWELLPTLPESPTAPPAAAAAAFPLTQARGLEAAAAAAEQKARRRPPPGTPRQPRPDEVGRTEYFSACAAQGLEYQTILKVHRRAILCGAVRKCSRGGGSGGWAGPAPGPGPHPATSSHRGPSWLLLSGGEDGYVLWDLSRGRPLLLSLEDEEEGPQASVGPAPGASTDFDKDLWPMMRVPPVRSGTTNLTALKQMLSVQRRRVADDANDDEDFCTATLASPLKSMSDGMDPGSGGGGMILSGASQRRLGAKVPSPPVGARLRLGAAGSQRRLGSHVAGDSDGSDGEERTAAAWQGASYRNMITAVAFISDSKWATCHPGGAIRVWAADQSYSSAILERTLHGHTGYINNIASYGGGRYAITTGLDTTARNWDLVEGRQLTCFTDHENEVTAVAVMESGRMALTAAEVVPEVASAMLWDPSTGKLLHTLTGHHGWLFGLALSERRKIAVAIGEHATLFIWNTETGNLLLSKLVASDGLQRWASINSDGNFLAFGSAEGVVRVVETFYGCELARFDSTWVDPDFHSISACFFCDDELHDAPEHWNNKFLSLQGDNSDISSLFRPQERTDSVGRSTSGLAKAAGGGAGAAGGGPRPAGIMAAASALSALGANLGASLNASGAAAGGGAAGKGGGGSGGSMGTKNVVRARMLHSVRAAAALAAIGRAAAAGHTHNDVDEDFLPNGDLDQGCRSDGDGKALPAAKTVSAAVGIGRRSGGGGGGDCGDGCGGGGSVHGAVRRPVLGTRRVAPLPAQLERVVMDPLNPKPAGEQAATAPPRPQGKVARFADEPPNPGGPPLGVVQPPPPNAPSALTLPNQPHLRFDVPVERGQGQKSGGEVDGAGEGQDVCSKSSGESRGAAADEDAVRPVSGHVKAKSSAVRAGRGWSAGPHRGGGGGGGGAAAGGGGAAAAGGGASRPTSAVGGGRAGAVGAGVLSGNSISAGAAVGGISRSAPSGGNLQDMLHHRNPTELEISPFGRRIVSLSGDGTVRVWSLLGVSVRRELPRHPEMVNEIAISRDRSLVATVSENEGCLRLFSMATGHLLATVAAHVGFDCDGVALSDDARLVSHDVYSNECQVAGTAVTCSDDTTIRIWDLSTPGGPECVRTLYGHAGGVTGVCWVPGSSRVLSVGEDRSVLEWEAGPGGGSSPVARMDHVHEDAIAAVVVSPDARRALTCSMDRTARLWELTLPTDLDTNTTIAAAAVVAAAAAAGGGGGSPSGRRTPALAHAAAAAAAASQATQGASGSPHIPQRPELHRFMHDNSVTHGAFSPDGRHVVTCGADCTVRLWDTDNGRQLACFQGHTRTVTRCVYLNSYVVATTSRDGTIRCWDMARKRRLPTLAPPFALENDSFEAMVLLPSQRCGYGFPEVLASLTSGRVVVYDPTYRQPLPEQLLLQLNPELELLGPPDVEDLVVDFPGLLVMPIRDGNTMLHMLAMSGDSVLLRALLSGVSAERQHAGVNGGGGGSRYGNVPPLPLNFAGQTPLDLAVAAGHRRCAELLLGTELTRPPEQRLAVLRAWHSLAVEMPSLLISFLKALSLDPAGGMEEDVLFAPMRANDEVMTLGADDLAAEDLWLDHVAQLREDLDHLPWYAQLWPLRHLWDYREKPTSPSVAGLPYVAMSARDMELSPLGVLVQHGLSQALASDVMYAVLFYKWESFAKAIFWRESLVYVAFVLLYLVASTMSVLQSPMVQFDELYDMKQPACVIRSVLEVILALMALHDIYGEITEVVNAGLYMYLTGGQSSWNAIEVFSCTTMLLTFGLQLGGFEGGSRFAMSLATILLGLRLLKVASGPEHTGVFVQALLRIVANLRFFILILVVLVLTFSIAFWQIMSFDLAPGETSRAGKDFDTLGNSIVTAYAYGVIGQMAAGTGTGFSWRPWMQVLMLTYTFLVTVILLNLLVAVMSDTYSVVKEHARSEWLLLRAKLILEIESSLPDAFFRDTQRSCPRWLHCLKVDMSGGRRGDETLVESLRGPIARHVLNTDLSKTEARIVDELHEVRDTLKLLHADVGNMRTAVAAAAAAASASASSSSFGAWQGPGHNRRSSSYHQQHHQQWPYVQSRPGTRPGTPPHGPGAGAGAGAGSYGAPLPPPRTSSTPANSLTGLGPPTSSRGPGGFW